MPTAATSWLIPAIVGGLGLFQNAGAAHSQNNLVNQAVAAQKPQLAAQNALFNEANSYDPAMQDAQAFQTASGQASSTLQSAMRNLAGGFMNAGGSPTGDTAFGVAANRTAAGIVNPLQQWMASQVASEPQRKMQALQGVFSAPSGQLGNTYMNAAAMKAPAAGSWQSALNSLAEGIEGYQASKSGAPGTDPGTGGSTMIGMPGSDYMQGGLFGSPGF